jgi:hypothetical protein
LQDVLASAAAYAREKRELRQPLHEAFLAGSGRVVCGSHFVFAHRHRTGTTPDEVTVLLVALHHVRAAGTRLHADQEDATLVGVERPALVIEARMDRAVEDILSRTSSIRVC